MSKTNITNLQFSIIVSLDKITLQPFLKRTSNHKEKENSRLDLRTLCEENRVAAVRVCGQFPVEKTQLR